MLCTVYDFAAYAEAAGREIRPAPRSRDHLPPISAWVDVFRPDGTHLGAGIVIAHDPDPSYLVVQVGGERHITHWCDCDWGVIGGAA